MARSTKSPRTAPALKDDPGLIKTLRQRVLDLEEHYRCVMEYSDLLAILSSTPEMRSGGVNRLAWEINEAGTAIKDIAADLLDLVRPAETPE
jgi:hypothetical protein